MTASPPVTPQHPLPPALTDGFVWHKERAQVTARGTVIPGLRASFYRRDDGEGTQSLGLYAYQEHELFVAWGYVGELHCRYNAVHRDDGGWFPTRRGCPVLRPIWEDSQVAGVRVLAGRTLVGFRLAELAAG